MKKTFDDGTASYDYSFFVTGIVSGDRKQAEKTVKVLENILSDAKKALTKEK